MVGAEMCWVDECDRRAAASVARDDWPGPLQLCARHTEDSRLNGERWTVTWDSVAATPSVVRPAPLAAVGREPSGSGVWPVVEPSATRSKSGLSGWRRRRS